MKKEYSYGVIPLRQHKDGRMEVLLVQSASWGHRWFPKWHIKDGETFLSAAKRELQEEIWIKNIDIDEKKMFKEQYVFPRWKQQISKHIGYFVGYVKSKRICMQDEELLDCCRVSVWEARKLLTYDILKKVFDDVLKYLGYQKFFVSLVPSTKDLSILNALKKYFYLHGFRYLPKRSSADVHITLSELFCTLPQLSLLVKQLKKKLSSFSPFSWPFLKIINVPQKSGSWIALLFPMDFHMNICTFAKPEKADDIVKIIQKKIPKKILFDKIVIGNYLWKHEFIFPLKSSWKRNISRE